MTYLCTFRIFVYLHTIFMHNVDSKSHPCTLCNISNFPCQVTDFRSFLYSGAFSVHSELDVLFCTRSKIILTYMSTFRIFVHIHTILMHNVDFKSDTYTLYYIWNLTLLSTKILVQSYTLTHFQFIVQLNVLFAISIKINDIFVHFQDICFSYIP